MRQERQQLQQQVLPSEWGTAKKPWFFLTKAHWFPQGSNRSALSNNMKALERDESEDRPSVEAVDDALKKQVRAGECVAIRGESTAHVPTLRLRLMVLQREPHDAAVLAGCGRGDHGSGCNGANLKPWIGEKSKAVIGTL